ncbi:MAG: hypothetical protein KAS78_05490, partial [Candidatus Pacebacteria bacterium]|nr:hypothetical protein [Candidatus Paceibacterota bacterium]
TRYTLHVTIVTGDLDALQLIDKNAEVYTLRKGIKDTVIYDEKAVQERYGLNPEQIIDYKGLRGDPSDNIPGVKGIGEKGAIDLLQKFGSMEKIYQAIEKDKTRDLIKSKVKEKLIAQKKEALMSKELATIKRDMDIKLNLEDCVWGDYDKGELNNLFRELEFYSLMNRVDEASRNGDSVSTNNSETESPFQDKSKKYIKYIILDTDEKVDKFLEELKKQNRFVFQTRSSQDDVSQKDLTGMVFMWKTSPMYYVPLVLKDNKPNLFNASVLAVNSSLEKLRPILEDEKYKKIGYFFKRDVEALCNHNIDIKGLDFDIMLAVYLLDPGKRDYSKDKIIFDYLGHRGNIEIKDENEIKEKIKNASEIAKLSHSFELYEIL